MIDHGFGASAADEVAARTIRNECDGEPIQGSNHSPPITLKSDTATSRALIEVKSEHFTDKSKQQYRTNPANMKQASPVIKVLALIALLAVSLTSARATDVFKANNTTSLVTGSSWSGAVVPNSSSNAVWDATVTGANSVAIGAGTPNWQGMRIANPGGPVTITGSGKNMILGSGGIDMSAASQNLVFSMTGSTITLGANQTWNVTDNMTLAVSSFSCGVVGTKALAKSGNGTLVLSGTNAFSGGFTNIAGTTVLGATNSLGTGPLTILGGTLDSMAANLVMLQNNAQYWNGDFAFAGTQNLDLGTGTVALGASRLVSVTNTLAVGGNISGSGFGLTLAGPGTLQLYGASTYTGNTVIPAGSTLALSGNGSLASANINNSGTFDVSGVTGGYHLTTGQTLTGLGGVTGSLTVNSGATLTVGGSAGTSGLGTAVVIGNLTLIGNTTLRLNKGGTGDQINVTGALTLGGTLNLSNVGNPLAAGDSFQVFSAGGTGIMAVSGSPGPGLSWDASQLASFGIIKIVSGGIAPAITTDVSAQTVQCGSNATFSAAANGSAPLVYNWKVNNTIVASGTDMTSFTTNNVHSVGSVYSISVQVTNAYGAAASSVVSLTVIDTTAPVVTLNGPNPATIYLNSTYSDPGATAYDACAGSRPVTTNSTVNTSLVGSYTVTFTALDGNGNTGTAVRTVNVINTGVWTNTAGGTWSTAANWTNAYIPQSGLDAAADFTQVGLTNDTTVDLDAPVTAGTLFFGDTATPLANWIVDNNGNSANILTLGVSSGSPLVYVNSGVGATLSMRIAGTQGLTKMRAGKLTLSGTNTFSGGITISNGTVSVGGTGLLGGGTFAGNITNFGTLDYSSTNSQAQVLSGNITGSGNVTQGAGTLTLSGTNNWAGTTINSGSFNLAASGSISMTNAFVVTGSNTVANLHGAYNLNITVSGSSALEVDSGSTVNFDGIANITGSSGATRIGNSSNTNNTNSAYFNMTGGSYTSGLNFIIAKAAWPGVATISGGTLYEGGGNLTVGGGTTNTAVGTLTINNTGTVVIEATATQFQIASANSSGIVNLDGGTLQSAKDIKNGGNGVGTSTFNFNGGTLKALTNSATFMGGTPLHYAYVLQGGAIIDDGGNAITISQSLQANPDGSDGGLTKLGLGVLTLSGGNSYTNTTTVSSGGLELDGSVAGDVVVNSNATFNGSAYVAGATTVKAGGIIQAGDVNGNNSLTVAGTLKLGNSATDKTTSQFNVAAGGTIVAQSALNVNGTNVINILDSSLSVGTNTLFTYVTLGGARGFSGFKLGSLPPGVTANLLNTGSAIQLAVTAVVTVNTNPPVLTNSYSGGTLTLSWPADHLGWRLVTQTNLQSTNWVTWPNSMNVTSIPIPVSPAVRTMFFRLVYP
jgi:autotransporter-associated beta strand protein